VRLLTTIADFREALDKERAAGRTVGFVPTMGFLHEGHASLILAARADCDLVAVSIFVNPLQFGPQEDLAAYPRDLDRDLDLCSRERADVVFHPDVGEMYPEPSPLRVSVGPLGEKMCGRARPGHFDGVATVVAKLFNIAGPCRAYFGVKDAQQLVVIRALVRALNFPVRVVGCPTVREPDGLAMSSRNTYLGPAERTAALVLSRTLDEAGALLAEGERDGRRVAAAMARRICAEPLARLDYAACVDPSTLEDVDVVDRPVLLAVAAWVGKARLIDNVTATASAAPIGG
jgi:pantoate--beta-alanine ligase